MKQQFMRTLRKMAAAAVILFAAMLQSAAQTPADWKALKKDINFIVANDLGRNGYYDQKPLAELMGRIGETVGLDCVAAPGDVHHFEGVRSTRDPLWLTNYELVYAHPELMLPWYPVCGNHEYRGNTQAVVDYAGVSARWNMPSRYYTRVLDSGKGDRRVTLRLVMLDTTPMIDKYRNDSTKYPDACRQDYRRQLAWADSVLAVAREDWVLVLGHHPIYADTGKSLSERTDMQARLGKVLLRHANVAMYICGHIHNFQHIRMKGSDIDYIVNSSGSLSRPDVKAVEGTCFCDGRPGFSLVCADKHSLQLNFIDKSGKAFFTVSKTK